MSVVISVRVKKEVKRILEEAGVNVAEEVRNYLENLAWKIKAEKTLKEIDELLKNVKPSPKGFAVESVREDRESH